MMVSLLDKSLQSFSLAVVVGGTVFTGLAVSREFWVQTWLDRMRASGMGGEGLSDGISALIENNGIYLIDDDLPDIDSPTYLHMNDVRIVGEGDLIDVPPLWRFRFKEISAWCPSGMARSDN
ncbi:hypothetical protein [Lentzea waywayandensis]|uniref:hypothetical protein n=1 Tax=Lentzea waywayandensis TaxID=84724 RepID=UPI001160295B|nr:hypothetical protein [Lentzea waywayandensis]